jgi:hypothetical protein
VSHDLSLLHNSHRHGTLWTSTLIDYVKQAHLSSICEHSPKKKERNKVEKHNQFNKLLLVSNIIESRLDALERLSLRGEMFTSFHRYIDLLIHQNMGTGIYIFNFINKL